MHKQPVVHARGCGGFAGDAFRAGFAVGLVRGWPLQQCLQLAAAAGALAVSKKGALPSLPTLDEVRSHLQANADSVLPQLLTDLGEQQGRHQPTRTHRYTPSVVCVI